MILHNNLGLIQFQFQLQVCHAPSILVEILIHIRIHCRQMRKPELNSVQLQLYLQILDNKNVKQSIPRLHLVPLHVLLFLSWFGDDLFVWQCYYHYSFQLWRAN